MTLQVLRSRPARAAGIRARLIAALIIAPVTVAIAAGCSSGPGAPSPAATTTAAATATRQVHVAPVGPDGAAPAAFRVTRSAASATCEPGSEAIGQAYRCFAGNEVYDPCWAERTSRPTVLCVGEPWAATGTQLSVTGTLGALPAAGSGAAPPWGVELAGGQRCVLLQGAHGEFDGLVIDYYCTPRLSLLRGLIKAGPLWRARSVVVQSGRSSSGPVEVITTAWFGTPGTLR
jgi:hypothetical protein